MNRMLEIYLTGQAHILSEALGPADDVLVVIRNARGFELFGTFENNPLGYQIIHPKLQTGTASKQRFLIPFQFIVVRYETHPFSNYCRVNAYHLNSMII